MSPPASAKRLSERDIQAIILRALQDPTSPAPTPSARDVAALVAAAFRHRVLLLLGWLLRVAGTLNDWPAGVIEKYLSAEGDAVAVDLVRHSELIRVLAELTSAGVRVLPFKGAALAHTHYPAPHVRVRTDTDLLVAAGDVPMLEDVVARLGYARPPETSGRLISYQSHYNRTDHHGVSHPLDVHWKISNMQALADRFTFEELWESRVPVPALGSSAVTIDGVHALLLALVHQAGHHPGSRDLLWIYDLHLIATRLTAGEMRQVQVLAADRGLGQIACEGLARAHACFGTSSLDLAVDALRDRSARQEGAAATMIHGPWSQVDVLRLDLHALPSWRARARLIREHLLPSASYMRARYGVRSKLLLPGLYVWRALLGAPKWLRNVDADG
jgi:hypothetical protein